MFTIFTPGVNRACQLRFAFMYWVYESYLEVIWQNALIN